ncbi:MAG: hypothetical protein IPK66_08215 [Rhodospirillales bacterium]|nr:hypothetical protein [Rhodospirillales bacterium]
MILFLSPPGVKLVDSDIHGQDIRQREVRDRLGSSPWRMPAEAIAHHSGWLREIVVIPSCTIESITGGKRQGTCDEFERFVKLFGSMFLDRSTAPRIRSLHELTGKPAYAAGIDFENATALVQAVHDAYEALNREGLHDRHIIVDITGGQKPPTVAGAMVALSENRECQYVSMHDMRILAYDFIYIVN